jgi:hypothetical protein
MNGRARRDDARIFSRGTADAKIQPHHEPAWSGEESAIRFFAR